METKQEIFNRYKKDYFKAKRVVGGRKKLGEILDKVCDVTKLTRKSAIRKFNHLQVVDPCKEERRGRSLYYTPDVTCALKDIWEAGGEVCGELLQPVIKEYVSIFQRDSMWKHGDEVTGKILTISEGTIKERISHFMKIKRKGRGFSTTQASQIKHIIPVFHGDWGKKPVGTGQLDTVAHCGHTVARDYVFTLNYVDIPVLWDVMHAQWNKGQTATQESLAFIRDSLPWKLYEVHPDTGSEFINWHMKDWCDTNTIKMTRSRPNHKNDNMHVEERNGHVIRKWIGYMRFDCEEAVDALNDVYTVLNPYLNHFVASRRVIEKFEVNGKWKKRYEKVAKTPYQRVLEHPDISRKVKDKLRLEHEKLNPAVMKKEIDRLKVILYDMQRKHGKTQK